MATAYTGINISPAKQIHFIDDVLITLEKHAINEDTKKDVLAILWSLKIMIIAK